MKKNVKIVAVLALVMGLLVGCGKSDNKESKNSKKDDKIIVYSNSVSDGRGEFLSEKAKEKGFNIEIVDIGGSDLLNRVLAEKDAPIADVVFGMNQMMFSKISEEGLLESYKPTWIDKVDPSLVQKDNNFSPLQEQRVFMIYNQNKIKKEEAAKDWQQLGDDSSLKGRYLIPKGLGTATVNAIVYNLLMDYQDESSDMGIAKTGWDEVKNFFQNGVPATEGQSEVSELANGAVDYAYTWLSNVPIVEKSLGIKLGIVNPPYGVPQTVEQVGIIKKDRTNSRAKDFVDFLGSAELQGEWAKKFGAAPVNEEAKKTINPRISEILDITTPQKNDYEFINKHLDEWVEYIELNILGS
ncbi:iron(III) transport system substrate-binding protein [Enterococcus sp. AZ194]|uniref:extracellular solute-binding protein n=1 Tax=Enterococcus sp. AZ194 TaxID=2774629 RepID=UPI003F24F818